MKDSNFKIQADTRPTDYIYALMSQHVYSKPPKGETLPNEKNWVVEREVETSNVRGFYAILYRNSDTKHMVIAYRGTVEKKTYLELLFGITFKKIDTLYKIKTFDLVRNEIDRAKNSKYQLSFTGHSLGAFLAELSVYYSHGYKYPKVNAVTFESPGIKGNLEKLQPNLVSNWVNLEILDIIGYLSYPNYVNTYDKHIGTIYSLYPELYEERHSLSAHLNPNIVNTDDNDIETIYGLYPELYEEGHSSFIHQFCQIHTIDNIVELFSKDMPYKRKHMKDWPIGSERYKFFKYAEKEKKGGKETFILDKKEMNTDSLFDLMYKGHYDGNENFNGFETLLLKHFKYDIRKFLEHFHWEKLGLSSKETVANKLKVKWKEANLPEEIIDYFLNFSIEGEEEKKEYICLHELDSETKNSHKFRKKLSAWLSENPKHRLNLLNLTDKNNNKTINIISSIPKENKCFTERIDITSIDKENQNSKDKKGKTYLTEIKELYANKEEKSPEKPYKDTFLESVTISGLGGVGKTELAKAYFLDPSVPYDVKWWVNAENDDRIFDSYELLLRMLGENDSEKLSHTPLMITNIANRLRENTKRWLFVYDNVKKPNNIEKFHPQGNGDIIATSRLCGHENSTHYILQPFNENEAITYFSKKYDKKLSEKDKKLTRQLVHELHTYPLVLAQAAAYMNSPRNCSIEYYLEKLKINKKKVLSEGLSIKNEYSATIMTVWNITMDDIAFNEEKEPTKAKELLDCCSFLNPNNIPLKIFQKKLFDSEKMEEAATLLSTHSMINRYDQYADVHRLVQEVTRLKLSNDEKDKILLKLVLTFRDKENDMGKDGHMFDFFDKRKPTIDNLNSLSPHVIDLIGHIDNLKPVSKKLLEESINLRERIGSFFNAYYRAPEAEIILRKAFNIIKENEDRQAFKYQMEGIALNLYNSLLPAEKFKEAKDLYDKYLKHCLTGCCISMMSKSPSQQQKNLVMEGELLILRRKETKVFLGFRTKDTKKYQEREIIAQNTLKKLEKYVDGNIRGKKIKNEIFKIMTSCGGSVHFRPSYSLQKAELYVSQAETFLKKSNKRATAKANKLLHKARTIYESTFEHPYYKFHPNASIEEQKGDGQKYNIAEAFREYANVCAKLESYSTAIDSVKWAMKYYQDLFDGRLVGLEMAHSHRELGIYQMQDGNSSKALANLYGALSIFDELGDKNIRLSTDCKRRITEIENSLEKTANINIKEVHNIDALVEQANLEKQRRSDNKRLGTKTETFLPKHKNASVENMGIFKKQSLLNDLKVENCNQVFNKRGDYSNSRNGA